MEEKKTNNYREKRKMHAPSKALAFFKKSYLHK